MVRVLHYSSFVHLRKAMTRAASLIAALVCCFELAASAQVSNTSEPPPKAPTYTPEQLFGSSSSRDSSASPEAKQESTPAPQLTLPPRPSTVQPPTRQCPPSPNAAPNTSSFPGVSASQLPRAGVSADAFTRPGVSIDQLRTLVPGNQTDACPASRDPVLNPDPVNPPRRIPSATDEQRNP